RFNAQQKALIASQEKLNALLLEKETSEYQSEKKADLGASFIKIGRNDYRLKIWNRGKAPAHNVTIEFPNGNEVLIESDIEEKFPLESLETHQSVELIASVHMGTKSKHAILIRWSDAASQNNEKIVY